MSVNKIFYMSDSHQDEEVQEEEIFKENAYNLRSTCTMDFDDMLAKLGEFGRFQKILFISMIPFSCFLAFVYFSQIFLTLIPEEYWCNVPELEGLTMAERLSLAIPRIDGEYSKCLVYDVNFTESLLNNISSANASWPTRTCYAGWHYNYTFIPYISLASERDWVCERAVLATYAQSLFFLGAIMGGLLFGWWADRYGRIPSLIACNLMGCAAGIITAYVQNFWQFAVVRFLMGFAFDNCFTMMYILGKGLEMKKVLRKTATSMFNFVTVLEYVGPRYRTLVFNLSFALFFTTAACLLPWLAYYLANWRLFALITSAPLVLAIFTFLILPESARWLISQGQIETAIKILQKMEKSNDSQIQPELYERFAHSCLNSLQENYDHHYRYSLWDIFKTPRLRCNFALMIIIWLSITLIFDVHVRNVNSLGLNVFLTFSLLCFTELPANTLLAITLDKFGRRWWFCLSLITSGLLSFFASSVPLGLCSASLAVAGRFFVNISYNVGSQYAAEILPTVVRAQGLAFIHLMGYVALMVAPFVAYLSNISETLPLVVLGFLGIISGLLSLFLPETLNHDLPETLHDGEVYGKKQ
uniref:Major facilitator superfamily (MFS) profile domain-containing protein n=1 Tax=Glossina morsitans morsitans TaxID=37546 RepID=A0A1B0F9D3_GLOMM